MKTFDFVWTFKMNGIHLYMNELDHDYRKKFNQKVLLRNSNIPFLYHKEAYRNISVVKSKNCSFWCFPKSIFTKLFSPRVVDCVKCEIFKDSIWTVIKVCQPSLIWNIQFTMRWGSGTFLILILRIASSIVTSEDDQRLIEK